MFRRSGGRFADENMRHYGTCMFRRSGGRFADENMRHYGTCMFRRSGRRFADKNMRYYGDSHVSANMCHSRTASVWYRGIATAA
jgi:hypothetical protein